MGREIKIAPSLLSADFACLKEEVRKAEEGGADLLHFDVMDGHFVPNITFGPLVVASVRPLTSLPFDVHLMISHPHQFIQEFAGVGANYITVHAESSPTLHRAVEAIKEQGVKAGVALCPSTPLSAVEYILEEIDLLLVMTVDPGYSAQPFITGMLKKVREAREMIQGRKRPVLLEVDGGVNLQTVKPLVEAGADLLVAGSAIFGKGGAASERIKAMRKEIL